MFEKFPQIITEFFNIKDDENFGREIFVVLQKILAFESGYIYLDDVLSYSYNPKETTAPCIQADLQTKGVTFGKIILTGSFTDEESVMFKSAASVIADIIKNNEISKIMKMQVEALQTGFASIKDENSKLLEAEQVKNNFISHVSHELRTPLNSILGYTELLNNEFVGKLNAKQKEFVNDISVSGLHLLSMVNEILDMTKIEAGALTLNPSTFEIKTAVNEVVNILKPLMNGISINVDIDDFCIKADYNKFQQILFNLLSNAIKYTKDRITITAHNQKPVVVSVKDNGIGIREEDKDKIFEKFEQLDNGKLFSTGLGLSIVKELVKLHGGSISVENNSGANFIITLPQG